MDTNTDSVDPDETAHNDLSPQDLVCHGESSSMQGEIVQNTL